MASSVKRSVQLLVTLFCILGQLVAAPIGCDLSGGKTCFVDLDDEETPLW